ncbi:23S rRNA (adenine(2030)-N(6))-methyltransferase RlmJ [Cognatishimia sp. F0-27]|uniref:23S rRNA (adenine(2030)-N(6))-methyltransferase RlmJ n=1 Tax=Cognatishimia sp. F0-27 TaxID=2816855 RepID=UPI001D0C29D1|nr:23S rRNA (adenine(2030)-N(6))-methyltransferase RlmJ [Cognatishimia sp. F0-27]MCC1493401.1 23S rRNA (adenine(2030)-N(6))-methyltransferase RlmJ [Cognatishimia sp. F0-27]
MLSYQHGYHAGNPADVHKHALLAAMLEYLTRKDKPLSYIETHAGRALYDLSGAQARKTGEAVAGITRLQERFAPDHPYLAALATVRAAHGETSYPGSPAIARALLRAGDRLHLAELHPQEYDALRAAMKGQGARVYHRDGFDLAQSLCPPDPRRGLLLIDPSWEIKTDYTRIPRFIAQVARKWPVGIIALWYPILKSGDHVPMIADLHAQCDGLMVHEVRFPPVRPGHRMVGSGMAIVNPPYGLDEAARTLSAIFDRRL